MPKLGQTVLVYISENVAPFVGIVVKVWSDSLVNVHVFDDGQGRWFGSPVRTSVRYFHTRPEHDMPAGLGLWCEGAIS